MSNTLNSVDDLSGLRISPYQISELLQASFRGQSSQPYGADTFGRIIDSFQPAQYKNLKTNYYDSSRV